MNKNCSLYFRTSPCCFLFCSCSPRISVSSLRMLESLPTRVRVVTLCCCWAVLFADARRVRSRSRFCAAQRAAGCTCCCYICLVICHDFEKKTVSFPLVALVAAPSPLQLKSKKKGHRSTFFFFSMCMMVGLFVDFDGLKHFSRGE